MTTQKPVGRAWRAAVRAANTKHSEGGFADCLPAVRPHDPSRPLMIIVHPGDAIEDGRGYSANEAEEVIAYGRSNALGMAAEITAKLEDHDVVILHRLSSIDTFMRPSFGYLAVESALAPYTRACDKASRIGTVLYGDDLDSCAEWLVENLDAHERPHVFLTGAYACERFGCITHVGRCLAAAGSASMSVSGHAPTDNCGHSPRWNPADTIEEAQSRRRTARP